MQFCSIRGSEIRSSVSKKEEREIMQLSKWILLAALMLPVAIQAEEKTATPATPPKQFDNPVFTQEALADPFCFYHEGTYYTIATGGLDRQANDGRAVP